MAACDVVNAGSTFGTYFGADECFANDAASKVRIATGDDVGRRLRNERAKEPYFRRYTSQPKR
jgi:hypothetical protein